MKKKQLIAALFATLAQTSLFAATGEVTLSGSTWTGKVDGVTKYTGSDMISACQACINAMSSGTVNLRNSGYSGSSGGVNKGVHFKSNIAFNGNNCTMYGNSGDDNIIYLRADRVSNVAVSNVKLVSTSGHIRYGVWFEGCNGMNIQNSSANHVLNGCFRADYSTAAAYKLTVGTVSGSNSADARESHTLKSDGISTSQVIGTVNGTDLGGCGLMFNHEPSGITSKASTVNATRCGVGQGYAGFRCANNNYAGTLATLNANGSERGFFMCSGSKNTTLNTANIDNSPAQGILTQLCVNTKVNAGHVHGSKGTDASIRIDDSSNHNVFNGLDIASGVGRGVSETDGSDYNTIQNCSLHGEGISLTGAHSKSVNNTP